jgi:membrane protein DedA with SNARE-associated domain
MTHGTKKNGTRTLLLWLAVVRVALGIIAIPLAPVLFEDHFLLLVLMRPTKEVLLAAGFLLREGDIDLLPLTLAAIPLYLGGVWHFFYLGKAFSEEICSHKLPGIAGRVLKPDRIEKLLAALRKKGPKLIVLGRLAAFSSAALAAAAGTAEMRTMRFIRWDLLGATLAFVIVVGAGYVFGAAYEEVGPWLSVVGVIATLGVFFLIGRSIRRA